MWLIICITSMCVLGVTDFMGVDWGIEKEYRKLPGRKAWQRKKGWSEILMGILEILYYAIGTEEKWETAIFGVIILTVVIFCGLNNRRFHKECVQWDETRQGGDGDSSAD